MRSTSLTLSLVLMILLIVGCSSNQQPAATALVETTDSIESSTQMIGLETPTSIASPSSTPTAAPGTASTSTPSVELAPLPTDFNAEDFSQFAQIQSYAKPLEQLLGIPVFNMNMFNFAYSPNGRYIAIGGCTALWSGRCINEAAGYSESFIVIQDAKTAEVVARLPEQQADPSSLAFTSDGEKLVYATYPVQVVIWDLVSSRIERVLLRNKDVNSYPQVAISPDDSIIATVVASQLLVWDAATGDQIADLPAYRYQTDLPQFSADGSRLAVFSADSGAQITVYDTSTWEPISIIQPSQTKETRAVFSPDGMQVATYELFSQNTKITLWDVDTGLPMGEFTDTFAALKAVAFSVDSKMLLVSGSSPKSGLFDNIAIWDIQDHQLAGYMQLEISPTKILFSLDGSSFLADSDHYPELYLWSLPDAAMIAVRQAAEDFLGALSEGDFNTAALLYQPTPEDISYYESIGLNPDDLPGLLESLCTQSDTGCLQPAEIVFVAKEYLGDYGLLINFSNPDGSLYTDQDGYKEVFVYVGFDTDGEAKINILPLFLYP